MFSVLVTGANRGIGLEFVRQLVTVEPTPKHVFATCRSPDNAVVLRSLKKSSSPNVTLHILKMDVTEVEDIKAAARTVDTVCGDKGLTVLLNNAGICARSELFEFEEGDIMAHYRVNAIAPLMVLREMLPMLRKAARWSQDTGMSCRKAAVINISSFTGSIGQTGMDFDPIILAYKASKVAMNMMMRIVSSEVKKDGILVLVMCPGWVKTDMGTEAGELEPEDSIRSMLTTMANITEKDHNTFIDRTGKTIPW